MGFFGKSKAPIEPLPLEDFGKIKAAAEKRKAEAARIRKESEQQSAEADILVRVSVASQGQVRDILEGEESQLKNIDIDDTTQVIIPLYLRENDVFRKALHGRIFLLLSEINEKMVSILSGIDIQVQSGETIITTQMYQRMNINGVKATLGDYILHPQIAQLQEISR